MRRRRELEGAEADVVCGRTGRPSQLEVDDADDERGHDDAQRASLSMQNVSSEFSTSWWTERVALYGSTTVSETLGDGTTENVAIMRSGNSSRILEMRRVPMPEPVPPPSECVSWKPWRASHASASLRTTSRTESTSSAPSV